MFQRIYLSLWLVFGFVLFVLFIADALSMLAFVVAGFVALALVFVGMMCLLPSIVAHPNHQRPSKRPKAAEDLRARPRNYESFLQPLFFPEGPEIRRPHYR